MALTDWHDTGRVTEYTLTGSLELYPGATEGAQGADGYLMASANGATLAIRDAGGVYRLQTEAGAEVRGINLLDWVTPWTAGYIVTIRMKEQVRFGRKPVLDGYGNDVTEQHWPEWVGEWRQVYRPRDDDPAKGYSRIQISVPGHPELAIDTWLDRAAGQAEEGEFPLDSLAVSSNLMTANASPELMARASSDAGGFLTADYTNQTGTHRPRFTTNAVEMLAGNGAIRDDEFTATNGPLWSIHTDIAVRKWDIPYPGAKVLTPFPDGDGQPVRYTAGPDGNAVGTVTGRWRQISAPGFVVQTQDQSPLRQGSLVGYALDPAWMESAGESHYEEREDSDGNRYVVKAFDSEIMAEDPVVGPFPIYRLSKNPERVLNACESLDSWQSEDGTPAVALNLDGVDKSEGASSLLAVVSPDPGSARGLWMSNGISGSGHFRYLCFDAKPPSPGAALKVWVSGWTRGLNPSAVDEEGWLTGDLWLVEESGDTWPVTLSEGGSGAAKVTTLPNGWFRVRLDMAANGSPGWGRLLWQIDSIHFQELAPGTWRFDNVRLVTETDPPSYPQCWWAVDKFMRQLGGNLPGVAGPWQLVGVETELRERYGAPTPFVTARLYENECLIVETNGCRVMQAGSLRKRIPADPLLPTTYLIRTIGEAWAELTNHTAGGWVVSSVDCTAPYDTSQWSRMLTYDLQAVGMPTIDIRCRPKYHSLKLYPRSDWTLAGTKILQGAMDGLAFDERTRAPLSSATVRLSRESSPDCQGATNPTGWFQVKPVPHSDLVSGLPLDGASGDPVNVDTRWDVALLQAGSVLWQAPKEAMAVNRALLEKTMTGKPAPERLCLEIGRLGSSFIGWSEGHTLMLRRAPGIGQEQEALIGIGTRPWLSLDERAVGLPLTCCYERDRTIRQRTSPDGGLTWGSEMTIATGTQPFFKHDPATGGTLFAYCKPDGIYLKRSSDGGATFLESEYRILTGVPEQAVCFDFTKDHRHGIRLLYRDAAGALKTMLSVDMGLTWQEE